MLVLSLLVTWKHMQKVGIRRLDCPARSPDFNPIELVCNAIAVIAEKWQSILETL